jgi:HEAT repeat protein
MTLKTATRITMNNISFLISQLASNNYNKTRSIAQELIALGDAIADQLIENLISSQKPYVRKNLAYVLGEIRSKDAVQPLISALNDEHGLVREYAAIALGKIGDAQTTNALVIALKSDARYDVREMAAWALGEIGDDTAIPALVDALADTEIEVVDNALDALIGFAKSDSRYLIEALSVDNADIQCGILEILSKAGVNHAQDAIIELLSHKNDRVRLYAVAALGELGDSNLIPRVLLLLSDEYYAVRASAAYALGKIGDKRAIEPLQKLADDPHEEVRIAAQHALETLNQRFSA